ncbi:Hypothetical protein CINCED_3A017021 [Cinara cedri]|nr:Hypothetical protein CINCED_3A017021 [Cinara cedri]
MGTMISQLRPYIAHLKVVYEIKFITFFQKLGDRFIVGGDYNAKYSHWGSRLITPKEHALLKAANTINAEIISTRKPNDPNKIPDLLDFF